MASTPRNGIADLNLEDDDSIKKMSEVAKFARQNNIPGYRPNGHHPAPKPQKQRSENSIRETPMSALRRRLSGWFGLSSRSRPVEGRPRFRPLAVLRAATAFNRA